ncbi:MAG: glycosyltransferase family 2 protein, partial [Terriglobia bacterium]
MTPENTAAQDPSGPLISVIVPCYNSERTIRQCLQSILNQHTSVSYDVLVVDSSTDRTAEIVRREFPSVRLIHLEKRAFSSAARNLGIRATEAPFCWMIDSDCIASPDEIERMLSRHHEAEYAAVA